MIWLAVLFLFFHYHRMEKINSRIDKLEGRVTKLIQGRNIE